MISFLRLWRSCCSSPVKIRKVRAILTRLTLDFGKSITTAVDGVLSALPLKLVSGIVETFVKTKRDVFVTMRMISIASDRLTRVLASDVALKSSLAQLLSLMSDIIQASEDTDATEAALECIAKLSRFHGKAQLPLFENTLPVIVAKGVGSSNNDIVQHSLNCLLSLLYDPLAISANDRPVIGARVVAFLPDVMCVVLGQLDRVERILMCFSR